MTITAVLNDARKVDYNLQTTSDDLGVTETILQILYMY